MPGPTTERTLVGKLAGVEPRANGWMRFSIHEEGQQWPVKCDTKKKEIIDSAVAMLGQVVTAQIGEQESDNINPNNQRPYMNRYLNSIALGAAPGAVSQPAQPQATSAPQATTSAFEPGAQGRVKEMEIMRQSAAKCAVEMISILPEGQRTPAGLVAAAETWLGYFVHGPARFAVAAFDAPQQAEFEGAASGAAVNGPCGECGGENGQHSQGCPNDDIPF